MIDVAKFSVDLDRIQAVAVRRDAATEQYQTQRDGDDSGDDQPSSWLQAIYHVDHSCLRKRRTPGASRARARWYSKCMSPAKAAATRGALVASEKRRDE